MIPKGTEVPKATLPDPPKVPGPFRFESPKLPAGLVPSYDDLLKPVRDALTKLGQTASPETKSGNDPGDPPKQQQDDEAA